MLAKSYAIYATTLRAIGVRGRMNSNSRGHFCAPPPREHFGAPQPMHFKRTTSGFFLDICSKTQGEKTKTQAQKTQNSRIICPRLKIPANSLEI